MHDEFYFVKEITKQNLFLLYHILYLGEPCGVYNKQKILYDKISYCMKIHFIQYEVHTISIADRGTI